MEIPPGSVSSQGDDSQEATTPCPSWGRWLVWGALLAFLAVLGLGLVRANAGQVQSGPAPDFELTTFDGEVIRLREMRGQVLVINFWASWCVECRKEAPALEATWRTYRERGVVFIGVDYLDTEREALAYIREFDITYPNGPDLGTRIAQAYRITGVPETFFIDRAGNIRGLIIGASTDADLRGGIELLLAEAP